MKLLLISVTDVSVHASVLLTNTSSIMAKIHALTATVV